MIGFLVWLIKWIIVPLVLSVGLVISIWMAAEIEQGAAKFATVSGVVAGLVVTAGYATVAHLQHDLEDRGSDDLTFNWTPLALGFFGTFLAIRLIRRFNLPEQLYGVTTLAMSAGSGLALLTYFTNGPARGFFILLAVSMIFGMLMNFVLFPKDFV